LLAATQAVVRLGAFPEQTMATNLELDDKLIEAAQRLGGHKTKREAVNRALDEYARWLRQQAILDDFANPSPI
jgi:Arc/MetJ family transcription regulator